MDDAIFKRLRSLGIKEGSKSFLMLQSIDQIYQDIEDTKKEIRKLNKKIEQLIENAEAAELLLMYQINKENR